MLAVRILFVCLLALVVASAPVYAADLQHFATTNAGDRVYFDADSIVMQAPYIYVNTYTYFAQVTDLKGMGATMVFWTGTNKWRIHSITRYDADGKKIDTKVNESEQWHDVIPGTNADVLLKRLLQYTNPNPKPQPDKKQKKSGTMSFGTGFFVTPSIVATCNHVIADTAKIEVIYKKDTRLSATVIGRDEATDVALLRVTGLEDVVKPLPLGNSFTLREGEQIYAVGFPLPTLMGTNAKISEGIVSSTSGFRDDNRMFQISAPVQPGNSGGPVLSTRAEVVGIVSLRLSDKATYEQSGVIPQNVNYAMKSSNLISLAGTLGLDLRTEVAGSDVMNAADIMDLAKQAVVLIVATY